MPCTEDAVHVFQTNGVLFAPGKAANAGGVAVSAMEMSQNSMRLSWTVEEVDEKLKVVMKNIYKSCFDAAKIMGNPGNFVVGANIAGFLKSSRCDGCAWYSISIYYYLYVRKYGGRVVFCFSE